MSRDTAIEAGVVLLTERTSFGDETGAGIMANRCAFTSRDMADDWPEAFTYAVVLGWDEAMSEVADKFGWDDELVGFLRDCHERFKTLKTDQEKAHDDHE